jgi:hypothetical protein
VRYDDVMDALRALDRKASEHYRAPPRYRRLLENRIPGMFGGKSNNRGTSAHGQPLNVLRAAVDHSRIPPSGVMVTTLAPAT